jgi:putative ABC transport system permease protein
MTEYPEAVLNQEQLLAESESWSYEDICNRSFKLILPAEYYQYDPVTGTYINLATTDTGMSYLYNSDDFGIPLRISGIVRQNEDAVSGVMNGSIGYTSALTEHVIGATNETEIVSSQLADPETDVINGLPFQKEDEPEPTETEKSVAVDEYLAGLGGSEKASIYTETMAEPSEEYVDTLVEQNISELTREYVEEMLVTNYAEEMGVDPQTITDYIADMDDETLFSYVREMMARSIREQYAASVRASLGQMTAEQLATGLDHAELTAEQYDYIYSNFLPPTTSDSTFEDNLDLLGYVDFKNPSSISIYSSTFSDKDAIADKNSGIQRVRGRGRPDQLYRLRGFAHELHNHHHQCD